MSTTTIIARCGARGPGSMPRRGTVAAAAPNSRAHSGAAVPCACMQTDEPGIPEQRAFVDRPSSKKRPEPEQRDQQTNRRSDDVIAFFGTAPEAMQERIEARFGDKRSDHRPKLCGIHRTVRA